MNMGCNHSHLKGKGGTVSGKNYLVEIMLVRKLKDGTGFG
jgi:hypothetical protein